MAIRWTEEQARVISARHSNLLVSAAAGSGKTAVLVERIRRLILDPVHPVDVDRLLEWRKLGVDGTVQVERLPKDHPAPLRQWIDAVEHGVDRVHILDGRILHCLLLEIFTHTGIGTEILKDRDDVYLREG